ncbi:hypothetical protein [Robbsia sp. KACC 23696]|uniref:hypothetical protein n=1 Tax=Robbsia sp. KACC 23696 TaxID=3149231 RepID=UPI00325B65D1
MTIVFTMTSRMITIAAACAVLLCVVLFLLGVQIGMRYAGPAAGIGGAATTASVRAPDVSGTGAAGALSSSSPQDTSEQ